MQLWGQQIFFKVKLALHDNRRVSERHTTKTHSKIIYRLLGASHVFFFMRASISAKVRKYNTTGLCCNIIL